MRTHDIVQPDYDCREPVALDVPLHDHLCGCFAG